MIWLDPTRVTLAGAALEGVSSVSVDRKATRFVEEHSDFGPHIVFADAPERRVTVRVVRRVGADGAGTFRPGDSGELAFEVGASASAAGGRRVSMQVVVQSIANRVDPKAGATQMIECVALSSDGAADPVSDEAVEA